MKINFTSNGELGNLIVTVLNPDDIFEVVKTLEFLEKFFCRKLSYVVDFNYRTVKRVFAFRCLLSSVCPRGRGRQLPSFRGVVRP